MTASLKALLGGAVDYAGQFPPAALSLEPVQYLQALGLLGS